MKFIQQIGGAICYERADKFLFLGAEKEKMDNYIRGNHGWLSGSGKKFKLTIFQMDWYLGGIFQINGFLNMDGMKSICQNRFKLCMNHAYSLNKNKAAPSVNDRFNGLLSNHC
jgi:hypothetical protein